MNDYQRGKMRDIRFRAWDKENKKMSDVKALDWQTNSRDKRVLKGSVSQVLTKEAVSVFDSHYSKPIWEMELMQYTGLKDKNGKEIYEGDIVEFEALLDDSKKGRAKVFFQDGSFIANGLMDTSTPLEIIGNVYENSNLLEND